jgi:hypothetical protein
MRQAIQPPSLNELETAFPLLLGGDLPKHPRTTRLGRESAAKGRYEPEMPITARRKTGLLDFLFGV